MDNIKDKHNLLIKYRNMMLKSKGINPTIYYNFFNYFNALYFIHDNVVYHKNSERFVYQRTNQEEFIEVSLYMFGLNRDKIEVYLRQLNDDLIFNGYIKNDLEENWVLITLPYTDKVLDELPF